jgi:alkylation response protein AidB-like acyl-CoA dehydrogenase
MAAETPERAGVAETSERFRARVRTWLDDNAPRKGEPGDFSSAHLISAPTAREYERREREALAVTKEWQRRVFEAGLAGLGWPREYGGHGGPKWQDEIVAEEHARYGVSTKMLAIALEMLPPVLFGFGTPEQRARHLPVVLRGQESWCQLLSEPGAGSDLASVGTRSTAVPGGWQVTGQKVWTSGAGTADFALLLARSEPVSGREGLSCFILDMHAPGVEVRPLRQMSGGYHFNEVFLEDVFVSEAALIGERGGGWPVLRTMLASERAAIGGGTSGRSAVQLVALARRLGRTDDAVIRQLVAGACVRERVLDLLQARVMATSVPAGGSLTKLLYSEHARRSADDAMCVLGAAGMTSENPEAAPWVERLLFAPGLRLGGGTDEIQRNTIAERGLGLPREPTFASNHLGAQ